MRSGFVALVGRPNAGKSTLLNRLVGVKLAIVSDKPQTTRHRILGVKTDEQGQVLYIDTPGIHRPLHKLNVRMVDAALESLRETEVVVVLVDATNKTGAGDNFVVARLKEARVPVILALNKIDLVKKSDLLPLIAHYQKAMDFAAIVPISAATGENVDALEQEIRSRLPESEPLYPEDYLTDQPERVLAAETVREKLLMHTRDELPFTTAVVVDQFEEPAHPKAPYRIFCTILVENDSQKPIVVGKGGAMIKRIGTEARLDLEKALESKVFLDLHVKVKSDWRDNERFLDELGMPPAKRRR
ncbi:MAG TPA: GTPase Era [Vicinamibacterales bacterium]